MEISIQILPQAEARETAMHKVAVELEASFLAEMLKFGGLGESRNAFNGGAGEEAFSGMLVREQAKLMAESGGIGLAEQIVKSLMAREQND